MEVGGIIVAEVMVRGGGNGDGIGGNGDGVVGGIMVAEVMVRTIVVMTKEVMLMTEVSQS